MRTPQSGAQLLFRGRAVVRRDDVESPGHRRVTNEKCFKTKKTYGLGGVKMNRFTIISVLVLVFMISVENSAYAQHGCGGNPVRTVKVDQDDIDTVSSQVSDDSRASDLPDEMQVHSRMMTASFRELGEHVGMMISLNNLPQLKEELRKHYEMMTTMHEQLAVQHDVCVDLIPRGTSIDAENEVSGHGCGTTSLSESHQEHY